MILEIVKYPDPSLALKAAPVAEITDDIRNLARDMTETMYEAEGIGLAAPQIGRSLRLVVIDPFWRDSARKPRVLVNPQWQPAGELVVSENEGCLSVPLNFRSDVPRYSSVRLQATDLDGNRIDEILEGMEAIVVQHETDHLEGTLFIDKISRLKRNMYDNKVKKWRKAGE